MSRCSVTTTTAAFSCAALPTAWLPKESSILKKKTCDILGIAWP